MLHQHQQLWMEFIDKDKKEREAKEKELLGIRERKRKDSWIKNKIKNKQSIIERKKEKGKTLQDMLNWKVGLIGQWPSLESMLYFNVTNKYQYSEQIVVCFK